jgi:hypothetical protein
MAQFDKSKTYYFVGNANLIEGINLYVDSQIVYLGKFMGYIAVPWSGDWLTDAKAKFETGTLSKGHYENIHVAKST